jgi:2-dehydro-3-deoxyphosphooctonate aldolase (KDO 8-P synthase)
MKIKNFEIGLNTPLFLIAGPCVIENETICMKTAEKIKEISLKLKFNYVFKSSYKKANRTSYKSFSTLGIQESLKILSLVKKEFDLPILTDIHAPEEASAAAEVADILQIPAFLCRQTDLLISAGNTQKIVNIKKGQFLSPMEMKHTIEKVESANNKNIMVTERGTFFGYNDLVVDMRSLIIMKKYGYPVIYDATHSVQQPGKGDKSGGLPEFILPLARAAAGIGISGIFIETHPNPKEALSDAESQLPLEKLENLLEQLIQIDNLVKTF